jgi:hypothetical protein
MNIALAVFPFIAAALRPASAGAAALQDSYGWVVRVLGVLLLQWVVVPLIFARQEASLRSRSRNAVIDLSAVRAAAHALFTAVTLYVCPLKLELVSYVLFSSLQRYCCVFIPVFAHDGFSYGLWNSLSAAVLNICTLGVFRHIGLVTAQIDCRTAAISDVCSPGGCYSFALSAQAVTVLFCGLLQGVCSDSKVPTVPVSKSHRFRSQLQNTFSCSLRTAAVASFLTFAVFVYAAHSPSTRDLLLTTPEVLIFSTVISIDCRLYIHSKYPRTLNFSEYIAL